MAKQLQWPGNGKNTATVRALQQPDRDKEAATAKEL
jgi:hypothetical protein